MDQDKLPYDKFSVDSIMVYAERLEGHTLREMTDAAELQSPNHRRGAFGNAVEQYYFKYKPNSSQEPDFPEVGIELKTTPLKRDKSGRYVAKERLVVNMIDYDTVVNEDFERSHFMQKASKVLLISYLWEKDVDPLDYKIVLVDLWEIPEVDLVQMKLDWETVVDKVRAGHAEDISGSDTVYLEACTKAADSSKRRTQPFSPVLAKPRAWALKASYMTAVENEMIDRRRQGIKRGAGEKDMGILELVRSRFEPYFGLSEEELAQCLGISKSKDVCARITKRILGVDDDAEVDEFVKAGIKPKTIRLRANGTPRESVSFPAFDYYKLAETGFEDSDFYSYLQVKYLFVLYEIDGEGTHRLRDVTLWQMPDADIPEARRCYEQMRENVRRGRADVSVRSTENRCCHVRPHGRDSSDTRPQPYGPPVVKKCFWLNAQYLAGEIARARGRR